MANEINIQYSTDDIKTKLKVSGSDNLDIREVNLGRNYIMNLSYYHNPDWMEQDLFERYDDYLDMAEEYAPQYTKAMQNWVGAYNKYNDLMHAVPAEGNVVLIGDPFKKLYCIKTPMDTAYSPLSITNTTSSIDTLYSEYNESDGQYSNVIDKSKLSDGDQFVVQGYAFKYNSANNNFKYVRDVTNDNLDELIKKLTSYHINEDIHAEKVDNYLLRLKNKNSDIAAIRIYNANENGTDTERKNNPEYKIQVVITYAQSGMTSAAKTYTMTDWISGNLTAEYMGLIGYTVQYIGTMGAYFVLAKDETKEAILEEYGVNLLREKHDTYTTIFQTQTEAMFSQEKYQCIAQNEEPNGDYDVGTRWLDTNSSPVVLKEYNGDTWNTISVSVSEADQANYENYQRYIDNYNKMVAVQNVLLKKERQATYMGGGYAVSNRNININLYTKGDDGILRYNGQSIEGDMHRAAEAHFIGNTVARQSIDQYVPIYYFTTSYDTNTYAVYLKGTTPYVVYADSQGVYQAIMDWITKQTDFEKFFTEDQWIRLSPLIREDEFSDSNFLLTGYESEEERLEICQELFDSANKELNTLCQPSLEFSMEMANILALPEFKPLINQFQLGNFVRVHIHDGYIKRARLLEIHLNFSDLSDFNCNFGNLVTTKSEVDKHAELLSQAVTAGKQVATSAGDWQRAVDKSNKLEQDIANGLQNSSLQIGRASGQAISWDNTGMHFRKYKDGSTTEYEPEEMAIINNALVATNDSWRTSKAAFGKYTINGETRWGPIAEYVTADTIEGKFLKGGSIQIGDETKEGGSLFIVHEDGSVEIKSNGVDKYASVDALNEVHNARQYHVELSYNKSTIFGQPGQDCTLTCVVYEWDEDITSKLPSGTVFSWLRNGIVYKTTTVPTLTVTNSDVDRNAIFSCSITFDETKIK